jgi:prevent-host-death family protein
MKITKRKTITELRSNLFETFEEVLTDGPQLITHKNGTAVALVSLTEIEALESEIELHKNLAIGYAQALRGEGVSTPDLKTRMQQTAKELKKKHG